MALTSQHSLIAWGRNDYGQLNVPSGNDFIAVEAGYNFTLALKTDGSIVAWGRSEYGTVPSDNGYYAISGGYEHCLALIPEPASLVLLSLGFGGLFLRKRK